MRRQRSTGDIQTNKAGGGSIRSTGSSASWMSSGSAQSAYTTGDQPDDGSNASFIIEVSGSLAAKQWPVIRVYSSRVSAKELQVYGDPTPSCF